MKILFNILTCNRFFYFKNCLESIIHYVDMDRIDILVCDNNTIEKGFDSYLDQKCNEFKNIRIKKFRDRSKNELYRAMNWAIKHATENRYDIIHFVQDDIQYLYKDDTHLDNIEKIFEKYNNIVQINCNLAWKRKIDSIGKIDIIKIGKYKYGILLDKRVCDNGFTRLSIYNKIGNYPVEAISWGLEKNRYVGKLNGEIWFGKKCYKLGYSRAIAYRANSGMMFDCSYVRGRKRYGKYFPPPGNFYFKMLKEKEIERIKKNEKNNKLSFIEDFCIPDGWVPESYGKHGSVKIEKKIYE